MSAIDFVQTNILQRDQKKAKDLATIVIRIYDGPSGLLYEVIRGKDKIDKVSFTPGESSDIINVQVYFNDCFRLLYQNNVLYDAQKQEYASDMVFIDNQSKRAYSRAYFNTQKIHEDIPTFVVTRKKNNEFLFALSDDKAHTAIIQAHALDAITLDCKEKIPMSKRSNMIKVGGKKVEINGSIYSDNIKGAKDKINIIKGHMGNDRIIGGDHDDVILGGIHDNRIDGGKGNDTIYVDDGVNIIRGGAGDDTITTGNDRDDIDGGDGDDWISAGHGRNKIKPGKGNNIIFGGNDEDRVLCHQSRGNHHIQTFGGDDEVYGSYNQDYILDMGKGDDHVEFWSYEEYEKSKKSHYIYMGDGDNQFSVRAKNIESVIDMGDGEDRYFGELIGANNYHTIILSKGSNYFRLRGRVNDWKDHWVANYKNTMYAVCLPLSIEGGKHEITAFDANTDHFIIQVTDQEDLDKLRSDVIQAFNNQSPYYENSHYQGVMFQLRGHIFHFEQTKNAESVYPGVIPGMEPGIIGIKSPISTKTNKIDYKMMNVRYIRESSLLMGLYKKKDANDKNMSKENNRALTLENLTYANVIKHSKPLFASKK